MMQKAPLHTELFRAAQHGDMQSLGILLEQHRAGLYAVALRFLGFGEAARDAVQETYMTALTHIGQVKEATAFGAWLYRVLRNYCLMQKRKEKGQGYCTTISGKHVDRLCFEDTERSLEQMAHEEQVRAAVAMLPEPMRLPVLLRYFSRFHAYDSIAEILHIPIGTVRSRLAAARAKLSEIIQSDDLTSHPLHKASEATTSIFHELWEDLYDNAAVRERFFEMYEKKVLIIGTSGKKILGRQYMERIVYDDLKYGAKFKPHLILSSGNITIVEGSNENSPEFPHHCPPESVLVLFHQDSSVYRMHIHDSK